MKTIKDQEFGGERPLYCEHDLRLENVTIHPGESSVKETYNIEAEDCRFEGKYVFWECRGLKVKNCRFAESARSSVWYSSHLEMEGCTVEAPKMFRRASDIRLRNCHFPNAQETLWDCDQVNIEDCTIEGADYLAMHTGNVYINNYRQDGNYSFQYSKNVEIHNAVLNSKDAFWECENVTIYDSTINGEYLGWYSKRLRLVRCHITGEQPLCYCEDLVLEDCTMGEDCNLAFEYSTVHATINGNVTSVKNPTSGCIEVRGKIGETIIDGNRKVPADCIIKSESSTF